MNTFKRSKKRNRKQHKPHVVSRIGIFELQTGFSMNGIDYDAQVTSIEPKDYPLHRAAFENDIEGVKRFIKEGVDVSKKNAAGDTPLHVATMLGRREIVLLLLNAGAYVRAKNNDGWSAMVEAISYGNRGTITEMLHVARQQARQNLKERKPHLINMLNELNDFYLEFKWDFHSWIPLVSRMLPSDMCKVYKKGAALRMDSSLLSMNDKAWERGDVSFLFNPALDDEKQSVVMDNNRRTFSKLKASWKLSDVQEEVDVLMSADVVDVRMSTKPIKFVRSRSGWFFRQDRSESICGYAADFYEVQNLKLITKKRREHLSPEDIKKNKSIMTKFTNGHEVDEKDMEWSQERRSLSPPPKPDITFEEYIASPDPVYLGRQPVVKTNVKSYTAQVAMSKDFPLSVELLVDALEVVAPIKRIHKLRKFCKSRLPPGFPVQLEIPIFATMSAQVTFGKFEWRNDLTDRMFMIPRGYDENPTKSFNI